MVSNVKRVKPRKLKGFADSNPETMAYREQIIASVRQVAGLAGFQAVHTPALEYAEVLLGVGGETDKQVFRFLDNGNRDVALRFDLTVPFARYVAEHYSELVLPFRRFQIGEVWRAEKPQKGRYRQFGQCDLDIVGVDSVAADAEVVGAFAQVLADLPVGPVTFAISHRGVLAAMISGLLGVEEEGHAQILIAVDKLEKIGMSAVSKLLLALPQLQGDGQEERVTEFLNLLIGKDQDGHTDLKKIATVLKDDSSVCEAIAHLHQFLELTDTFELSSDIRFQINLSVVRGLGYYTGLVFETTLDHLPSFGSICSGGRYDRLVERFMSTSLSGMGGSLGLDRLVAAMFEMKSVAPRRSTEVFVAVAGAETQVYGMRLVQTLRAAGISTDMGLKVAKLGQQFRYADRKGYRFVLTVGASEMVAKEFSLKDLSTGSEERCLAFADVAAILEMRLQS